VRWVRSFLRALRDKIFWLFLLTAVAGMLSVPWWVVLPLTLAALSIDSLPKYILLWPRAQRAGAEGAWWIAVTLSTAAGLATASAAYLLGVVIRWVWW
jgi:hypothetical protein